MRRDNVRRTRYYCGADSILPTTDQRRIERLPRTLGKAVAGRASAAGVAQSASACGAASLSTASVTARDLASLFRSRRGARIDFCDGIGQGV